MATITGDDNPNVLTAVNAGGDTLDGLGGNDTLIGFTGPDILNGGLGDDILIGNVGNDTLDGGAGQDQMTGGAGDDTYFVDDVGDGVFEVAGGGIDRINTTLSTLNLVAEVENLNFTGTGDATLNGNNLDNVIDGGAGNDTIDGNAGDDTLNGGAGNDTLNGGTGNDRLGGGAGNDTLNGGDDNDVLAGGAGNDTLNGGIGDDVISGDGDLFVPVGAGQSNITDNVLTNNTLATAIDISGRFNLDNDPNIVNSTTELHTSIVGQPGGQEDVFSVTLTAGTQIRLDIDLTAPGVDTEIWLVDAAGNVLATNDDNAGDAGSTSSVDSALTFVVATTGTYFIVVNEFNSTSPFGAGSNPLDASDNYTLQVSVNQPPIFSPTSGPNGNDVLNGGAGNDILLGDGGNDTLNGGAGNDTLIGGTGIDLADYSDSTGSVTVNLATGTATGADNDILVSIENVTTGSGNDTLTGDGGNNVLDGGAGADAMAGGLGDDTYIVDNVNDSVSEGALGGNDTVRTSLTAFTLQPEVENLVYDNGAAADQAVVFVGNNGFNNITGGAGADTLFGLLGNDVLDGGAGADILNGGADNDTYIVDNVNDVVVEGNAPGDGNADLVVLATGFAGPFTLGVNVENLDGNALANTLTGNSGNNIINGNAGDDIIDGAGGTDTLNGGAGNDRILTDGGDTIDGGAGTDTVVMTAAFTLTLGVNEENAEGSSGNDTINGNAGNNVINGNAGNDTINGLAGDDTLSGGAGDDTLDGGLGNDTFRGGAGNDTFLDAGAASTADVADYSDTTQGVTVDLNAGTAVGAESGTDTIQLVGPGNSVIEIVLGGSGNDTLRGDEQANTLNGGAGDDTLEGRGGLDSLIGGTGNDTYITDTFIEVTELAGQGTDDTIQTNVSVNLTIAALANVENVVLTGLNNVDATGNDSDNDLTGNDGNNDLRGNDGEDRLFGNGGNDTLDGGANRDQLFGGIGNDDLFGGDGNDRLDGGTGNDDMTGGTGNDVYIVDSLTDTVNEDFGAAEGTADEVQTSLANYVLPENVEILTFTGAGNFTFVGNDSNNTVNGGTGNDTLSGGGGDDTLNGGAGNDRIIGGAGDDVLTGGSGLDLISGGDGNDTLNAGNDGTVNGGGLFGDAGNDTLNGGNGADNIVAGDGNDLAFGGAGNDFLYGQAGEDTLNGGAGVDVMLGGSGDDTINGGAGIDYVFGEGGNDTIVFDNVGSAAAQNIDVVQGFTAGGTDDKIVLKGFGADLDTFQEVLDHAQYFAALNTTIITIENANGITSKAIWLVGVTKDQLTAADFEFQAA